MYGTVRREYTSDNFSLLSVKTDKNLPFRRYPSFLRSFFSVPLQLLSPACCNFGPPHHYQMS